jgi:hypothetical protein
MPQAVENCETAQLELESSAKFLAIKHCQQTKVGKVINLSRSSFKKWSHICNHRDYLVNSYGDTHHSSFGTRSSTTKKEINTLRVPRSCLGTVLGDGAGWLGPCVRAVIITSV